MTIVKIVVEGEPFAKGSKTAVVRGTRAVMIEGAGGSKHDTREQKDRRNARRKAREAWVEKVETIAAQAAREHGKLDGQLWCEATFWKLAPKRLHRAMIANPTAVFYAPTKPDLDKYIRAAWDPCVKAGLISDDSRICLITQSSKRFTLDRPRLMLRFGVIHV